MCPASRLEEFARRRREASVIDSDSDDSGPYPAFSDSVPGLPYPAKGNVLRLLGLYRGRKITAVLLRRVARIGQDVQTGRLGEPLQEFHVPAHIGRSTLHQRFAARRFERYELGQNLLESLLHVIADGARSICPAEITNQKFIAQRHAQPGRIHRSAYAHDLARA